MEAFAILAGIVLALCMLALIIYIMYDATRNPLRFVFIGGDGRKYKSEIETISTRLRPRFPGKIKKIEATPSHIYYLVKSTPDVLNLENLTIAIQRPVQIYPAANGVWVSVHYHPLIEESYKPYLNIYPEQAS